MVDQVSFLEEIEPFSLDSWDRVNEFISGVAEDYRWIIESKYDGGASIVRDRISQIISEMRTMYTNGMRSGWSISHIANQFSKYFIESGQLVHAEYEQNRIIQGIRKDIGDRGAIFAYGFLKGILNVGAAKGVEELSGALSLVFPGMRDVPALSKALSIDRASFRADVRKVLKEVRDNDALRDEQWQKMLVVARLTSLKWARKRISKWKNQFNHNEIINKKAVDSIAAVELSYRESMKLLAPVEYWNNKAKNHNSERIKIQKALLWYFPICILFILVLFILALSFLIFGKYNNMAAGVYFIFSAGLASLVGVLLWIGRLGTKLYLSEHHLKRDAEERAVMTTTYLALTAEEAAQDVDRQIILQALFRGSTDGIVKEDGGFDPNLASMFAKALARN